MERFRLPSYALPQYLYRVRCPDSQTIFAPDSGYTARDTSAFYTDDLEFGDSTIQAFTWFSRIPSPYIALFSEKEHAENWALSWSDRVGEECEIITIDSRELDSVYVSRLSSVVDELKLTVPYGASQHIKGAYLCLHRIPASALCVFESCSGIRESKIVNTQFGDVINTLTNFNARTRKTKVGL